MKLKNPLLVVSDLEASKRFYREVLGLRVILDFGANVTLTGGLCLQTQESWKGFLSKAAEDISFGGNDAELYFEEENFESFLTGLEALEGIRCVHPVKEHSWGQRVVRLYDPDLHIIEIGESMKTVCRRFSASGMTVVEIAERMDVPVKYVTACLR